jgi:TRAP-type mannitol/chloroaromatic compound transport system permease small subunit
VAEPPRAEPLIDRLARRIGELFSYLFFASMVIIAYEVVSRYGFNAPTVWVHDATTALCGVGFLVSGVYTLQRRAHIRITLVYDRLPRAARRVLDLINGLIMLGFVGLLGWQSSLDAYKSISIMETAGTASRLPLPPIVKSAMVFACVAMFALGIAQLARTLRGRDPAP